MKKSDTKAKQLQKMYDDIVALKKSPLYKYRTKNKYVPVIGEGSADASILFVGEAPGKNEAITGKPFCGAAGKILGEMLAGVGITRAEVYITSVVKDRPPENRDPTPAEIRAYSPFLDQQINLIQPKVIATLGRYAFIYIMEKFGLASSIEPISAAHGKTFTAATSYGIVTIVALYHPSVASYRRSMLPMMKEDFKVLKKFN